MFDLYTYIFDFTPIKQKVTLYPLFSITSSIFGSSLTCKFWWVLQLLGAMFGFQVLLSAQRELRQNWCLWIKGQSDGHRVRSKKSFPLIGSISLKTFFYSSVTLCQLNCEQFTFINFARLVLIAFAVFYVTIVGAMKLRTAFMQVETDNFE